jgi:hypothetical protein
MRTVEIGKIDRDDGNENNRKGTRLGMKSWHLE